MTQRIRGDTLQRIRRQHFREYPLCIHCTAQGRVKIAVELDHIQALVNGGTDTADNRQGLCSECHKRKTAADMGWTYRQRITVGADGWPSSAMP